MTFAEFDRVHRRSLRTVNEVLGTRLFHREIPARETHWEPPSSYGSRPTNHLQQRMSSSRFDSGRDFQSSSTTMSYGGYGQRNYEERSGSLPRSSIGARRQDNMATRRHQYHEEPASQYRSSYHPRASPAVPPTPIQKPARSYDRKREDLDFLNKFNAPLRQEPVKGPRVKRFPTGLDFDSGLLIKPSYGTLTTELRREISEETPYPSKSTMEVNLNRLDRIKKMATPHLKRKPVKMQQLKSDSDTSMDVSFSMLSAATKPPSFYRNRKKIDETAKSLAKELASLLYVFDSYKINTVGHARFLEGKLKEIQKKAVLSKICQNDFPNFLQSLLRLRSRIQKALAGLDDQRIRMIIKDQLEDCSEQLLRIVV